MNSKSGGSYLGSLDWIKKKKTTINSFNKKDNQYFQYTVTFALNHEEIKKYPKRITKIKLFMDKHNQEEINYSSEKDDWKKFEKNNLTISLDVLYATNEETYPSYVTKQNSNHEKQAILLMISNEK